MTTARVELTRAHRHAGRNHPAGAVLELPRADARWLIAQGRARALPAAPESPAQPPPRRARGTQKTAQPALSRQPANPQPKE